MQYRRLGRSGLIVSALSLGTMQFGTGMNMGNLDQKATSDMIDFAIDHGINFIDTADVYSRGESERLIGNAIKGKREDLVIATKVRLPMSDDDFNRSGATRANIIRGVESSLKRLQTDYIDLYQLHGWDSNTPLEETLRTMDDLVRQGNTSVRYGVRVLSQTEEVFSTTVTFVRVDDTGRKQILPKPGNSDSVPETS